MPPLGFCPGRIVIHDHMAFPGKKPLLSMKGLVGLVSDQIGQLEASRFHPLVVKLDHFSRFFQVFLGQNSRKNPSKTHHLGQYFTCRLVSESSRILLAKTCHPPTRPFPNQPFKGRQPPKKNRSGTFWESKLKDCKPPILRGFFW